MSELLDKLASEGDKRRKTERRTSRPVATSLKSSSKPKRLNNWERIELEELTQRISSLESDIVRLDGALSQPDLYRRGNEQALALTSEREEVEQTLKTAMLRWEELAERE
jgi:ATP-binding cassette subfamily F protein uup